MTQPEKPTASHDADDAFKIKKWKIPFSPRLAREAKGLVLLAFRHGPIENVHAGKRCPACDGNSEYSRITDEEMKEIMKSAISRLYTFLYLKELDPEEYERNIAFGNAHTRSWDEPVFHLFDEGDIEAIREQLFGPKEIPRTAKESGQE